MSAPIPFDFERHSVRAVASNDEPVFIAKDVCRTLEIRKYRDAIAQLDDDERVSVIVDTLGGPQTMTAVTESGLYALIMMSRKPAARRFRKWVTSELLPALRRMGRYELGAAEPRAAEHEELRAQYRSLPLEKQRRIELRAKAVSAYDALVAGGEKMMVARREVAEEYGVSVATIARWSSRVRMVAEADRPVALMPMFKGRPGWAPCHPKALAALKARLARPHNRGFSACYRGMLASAESKGWSPVPSEAALRRHMGAAMALTTPTPN